MVNVRLSRQRAGLSQQDLATAAGVSQATISRLENRDDVDPETWRSVVETLGYRVETRTVAITTWADEAALIHSSDLTPDQRIAEAFHASEWSAAMRGRAAHA